jgi:hypothetical protein
LSVSNSSEVPLVLNLTIGSITLQYHLVFLDDRFSTVESTTIDDTPSTLGRHMLGEHYACASDATPDMTVHLQDDWLTST